MIQKQIQYSNTQYGYINNEKYHISEIINNNFNSELIYNDKIKQNKHESYISSFYNFTVFILKRFT